MSIVIESGIPVPAATRRTRTVETPYGTFFAKAEIGQSFVMVCPISRVRDAELADSWVSSTAGNVKQYAKRNGKVAATAQVTGEASETGLGVRVWYERDMTADEIADRDAKRK